MFKRLQKSRENRTCTDVLFIEYPHDLISDWLNSSKTYMSGQTDRIETCSIPSVNIYAVCFPNLHGMFCHLLWNIYVKTYRVNRALNAESFLTKLDRKQALNVLYKDCVFTADQWTLLAALASDWLRHIRSPLEQLNGFWRNLTDINNEIIMFFEEPTSGSLRRSSANNQSPLPNLFFGAYPSTKMANSILRCTTQCPFGPLVYCILCRDYIFACNWSKICTHKYRAIHYCVACEA